MKFNQLKSVLRAHPSLYPRLILPDGDPVPAHFHITEVGHVAKRFIDCGGTLHDTTDTCVLQTYVADDIDHRLNAGTFAMILDLGQQVLPHDDLDVEVEYEDCSVSQYPIETAELVGENIELRLRDKHTDCLAKQKCGIDGKCSSTEPASACC